MGIRLRCARGLMGREEVKIAIFPSSLTHLLYVQVSGPFLVPYLSENDHFRIPPNTLCSPPRPCPHYHVVLETHRSILVHTTVLMRFLLSSLERQKTRLWYFRSPFSFRHVFYRPHYYKCMRFRFDHFQERFQIDSFQRKHISTLCSNFIQNFVRGRGMGGKQSVLWGFENREYAPWFLGSYNNSKNGVKILGTG